MAQLDSTEFKIQTQSLFPTNGVGGITANDLRTQMDNVADSTAFILTGQTAAPTVNDDDSDTSGNGVFQVGHIWVDETADAAYVCLDNSTGAAVWVDVTVGSQSGAAIVAAIDAEIGTEWRGVPAIVAVAASRDLALTDGLDILEVDTSGGAVTVTIPTNASVAFAVGTVINITLIDASNAATLTAAGGVALNGVTAGSGTITNAAYSAISLYKRATDAWVVKGDIGAIA